MNENCVPARIETAHLVLACWQPGDAVGLAEALHESREQLLPWLPWAAAEPEPVEAKLELILRWRDALRAGEDFHYGIFARGEGRVLGALGIHPRVGPDGLELGYWVRASAAGAGVATEAAAAAARVALELMGARRVEIHVDSRNAASARIPRKLGFTCEARLREWMEPIDGERGDRLIFGLLTRELSSSPAGAIALRVEGLEGELLLDDLARDSS